MLTKPAGIPLTRGLARALAPYVRVNAIEPSSIDTGWISALSDEDERKLRENIPLKRWGDPEDIAKVAVFLSLRRRIASFLLKSCSYHKQELQSALSKRV